MYLATLTPRSLEMTGEVADGWLGTSFMPEHANVFLDHLTTGAKRAGRTLDALDLHVSAGVVAFGDSVERLIPPRKPGLAFSLGAMGSRQHNFYNEAYRRAGYEDVARTSSGSGSRVGARRRFARVPDELVLKTNLLGTDAMVRERLRVYNRAGITTIRVEPAVIPSTRGSPTSGACSRWSGASERSSTMDLNYSPRKRRSATRSAPGSARTCPPRCATRC